MEQPKQPETEPVYTIRFAETEDDMIALHRFMLVVGRPQMRCEVDVVKSLQEVIRVVRDECALMLMVGDVLVGTMAIMKVQWWYGQGWFMVDRWNFILAEHFHSSGAKRMFQEAVDISKAAGIEFIHFGKIRGPKNGVFRMMPRAYEPDPAPEAPNPEYIPEKEDEDA